MKSLHRAFKYNIKIDVNLYTDLFNPRGVSRTLNKIDNLITTCQQQLSTEACGHGNKRVLSRDNTCVSRDNTCLSCDNPSSAEKLTRKCQILINLGSMLGHRLRLPTLNPHWVNVLCLLDGLSGRKPRVNVDDHGFWLSYPRFPLTVWTPIILWHCSLPASSLRLTCFPLICGII